MSVARPENASEAKVIVSPEFCAQGTVSGENSDMNVQATGVALDSESQATGCRTRLGESSYGARIADRGNCRWRLLHRESPWQRGAAKGF